MKRAIWNPYPQQDFHFGSLPVFDAVMGSWDLTCLTLPIINELRDSDKTPAQAIAYAVGWSLQTTGDGVYIGQLAAEAQTPQAFIEQVKSIPLQIPVQIHGKDFWGFIETQYPRFEYQPPACKILPFRRK
jgi:hypothetical protein